MQGKATIAGHPVHPMIIPLPIGFFVGSLFTEITYWITHNTFWPQMSVVLLGAGIVAAGLASIVGYINYRTAPLSKNAKSTGTRHMICNILAVLVYAAALYVLKRNLTADLGGVLVVVGSMLLAAAGYFGGHLSYHHGIGVDEKSMAASRAEKTRESA